MVDAGHDARALGVGHGRCGIERHRDVERVDGACWPRRIGVGRCRDGGVTDIGRYRGRGGAGLAPRRGVHGDRGGAAVERLGVEGFDVLALDPVLADAQVLAVRGGGPAVVHEVVEGGARLDLAGRRGGRCAGTAGPGGAVAVRLAAMDGRQGSRQHLEEQEGVGRNRSCRRGGLGSASAVVMAARLVSLSKVARLLVATTWTFHHSGSPPFRVATTWSCAGIGTASRLEGTARRGSRPGARQVDGGRMVDAGGRGRCTGSAAG